MKLDTESLITRIYCWQIMQFGKIKYFNGFSIILFIFIIKLITVLYLVDLGKCQNHELFEGIASLSGDANSYIDPVDHLLTEGTYYSGSAKAGRMPYLGFVYMPFRIFFSKSIALSILVILQVLFESIAIYLLAKLLKLITGKKASFWIFIIFSLLSLNVTNFDYHILSESFGISFLCIFSYYYYIFLKFGRTNKQLFIAGIFLALAVLFKPYLSPFFIIIGFEFCIHEYKRSIKELIVKVVKNSFLVSIPLLLFLSPWIIRNAITLKKFVPFQQDIYAGYNYTKAYFAYRNFVEAIGDGVMFWDKNSAGCYFEPHGFPCDYKFPDRIFSVNLTMEKIEDARDIYTQYCKKPTDSLQEVVIKKFNILTEIYISENTAFYYFATPFLLVKKFIFHSGSYYLPISKSSPCYSTIQWVIKLAQSALYYICLIFGFVGLIAMFRFRGGYWFMLIVPLYLILLFPIIFKGSEFRMFHMAYPFLLMGVCFTLIKIIRRKKT